MSSHNYMYVEIHTKGLDKRLMIRSETLLTAGWLKVHHVPILAASRNSPHKLHNI